jgi:hypothetical protein
MKYLKQLNFVQLSLKFNLSFTNIQITFLWFNVVSVHFYKNNYTGNSNKTIRFTYRFSNILVPKWNKQYFMQYNFFGHTQ